VRGGCCGWTCCLHKCEGGEGNADTVCRLRALAQRVCLCVMCCSNVDLLVCVNVVAVVRNERPTNAFLSGADTRTLSENAAIGTVVGTLSATDPDLTSTLTYSLTNNGGGKFSLTGTSLLVLANIDYEVTPGISVTVTVTDQGGLSFVKTFTIVVVRWCWR
jgi:hypothetical protein